MKRSYHKEISEKWGILPAIVFQAIMERGSTECLTEPDFCEALGMSLTEFDEAVDVLVKKEVITKSYEYGRLYAAALKRWRELEGITAIGPAPQRRSSVQHRMYGDFPPELARKMTDAVLDLTMQRAAADAGNDRILGQAKDVAMRLLQMGWQPEEMEYIDSYYRENDMNGRFGRPIDLYSVDRVASPALQQRQERLERQRQQKPLIEVINPDGTVRKVQL